MDVYDNIDRNKIKEAIRLLTEVRDYYEGYNPTKRYNDRLNTVISKLLVLDDMLTMEAEK